MTRMRKEVEEKRKAREVYEQRRQKLLDEKKERQENLLRQEHERSERKAKKRMLEERWSMVRWITEYIDTNTQRWEEERKSRVETEKESAERWKKMERLEKIRIIREKNAIMQNEKSLTVTLRPPTLLNHADQGTEADHTEADPNPKLPSQEEALPEEAPACHTTRPDLPEDQADQGAEADPSSGPPTKDDALQEDDQTCSRQHTSIIQPLAIIRAVTRCVEFPDNNIFLQTLTSHQLSSNEMEVERSDQVAEADHIEADQIQADPHLRPPSKEEAKTEEITAYPDELQPGLPPEYTCRGARADQRKADPNQRLPSQEDVLIEDDPACPSIQHTPIIQPLAGCSQVC